MSVIVITQFADVNTIFRCRAVAKDGKTELRKASNKGKTRTFSKPRPYNGPSGGDAA